MSTKRVFDFCATICLAMTLASTANADLYLMLNIGDNEDREVPDAGITLPLARDGSPPAAIDSAADRYFVPLPYATMDTLSGSARRVGAPDTDQGTIQAVQSISESMVSSSADSAPAAEIDMGDTDWVEYETFAASLKYFSPDGTDQESEVRYEPARIFLRRFEDGNVYVMITGENGAAP